MTGWLEVARRVHHDSAPSDFEVHLAAQRVLARMNQRRTPRFRRMHLAALAVLFVGGLAYAASRLGAPEPASSEPPTPSTAPAMAIADTAATADTRTTPSATPTASAAPVAPRVAQSPAAAVRRVPVRNAASPKIERADAARVSQVPEPPKSDWREVESAMNVQDYARAERALESLAGASDDRTRENASLGLAQLAVGRGDCEGALKLLARVEREAKFDSTRRRARDLARRCR